MKFSFNTKTFLLLMKGLKKFAELNEICANIWCWHFWWICALLCVMRGEQNACQWVNMKVRNFNEFRNFLLNVKKCEKKYFLFPSRDYFINLMLEWILARLSQLFLCSMRRALTTIQSKMQYKSNQMITLEKFSKITSRKIDNRIGLSFKFI